MKPLENIFTARNILTVLCTLAVIFVLLKIDGCRNSKFQHQQGLIDSISLSNQKLVQDKNSLGETISKQQVIITQDQGSLMALSNTLFNWGKIDGRRLKQINDLIQIKSNTHIEKVPVPYVDLEKQKKFSDSVEKICKDVIAYYRANTVEVPRKVSLDTPKVNPYLSLRGTVLKDKFMIDSFSTKDTQNIAIVETKGGLFRRDIKGKLKVFSRSTMEIQVKNENPLRQVTGLTSISYKPKVKGRWLERGILVGLGVVAAKTLLK